MFLYLQFFIWNYLFIKLKAARAVSGRQSMVYCFPSKRATNIGERLPQLPKPWGREMKTRDPKQFSARARSCISSWTFPPWCLYQPIATSSGGHTRALLAITIRTNIEKKSDTYRVLIAKSQDHAICSILLLATSQQQIDSKQILWSPM